MQSDLITVYLHGFGGDNDGLVPLARELGFSPDLCIDMPGFGKNPDVDEVAQDSVGAYAEIAYEHLLAHTEGRPMRLVGHSHGAMVAYVIALSHPEMVRDIIFLCPVGKSSWLGGLFLVISRWVSRVIGYDKAYRLVAWRPMVDLVTILSWAPGWTRQFTAFMIGQRRKESKRYSSSMLRMIHSVPSFVDKFDDTRIETPALICLARDDRLVTRRDVDWYMQHVPAAKLLPQVLPGGHVMPVLSPARLAELIRAYYAEK